MNEETVTVPGPQVHVQNVVRALVQAGEPWSDPCIELPFERILEMEDGALIRVRIEVDD